ncbi:MAG: class I SAM-dependent methyltransferase [Candidatus Entotheonellia bacterium]
MDICASNILKKVMESVEYRGMIGTFRVCIRTIFLPVLNHPRIIKYQEYRFDRKFGVDTAGVIRREELNIDGPSAKYATDYEAAPPVLLKEAIAGLRIHYQEFTFVDFGCGKGKALLMASAFPFDKIIGVELSPNLKAIAAENVKQYKAKPQQCRSLEVVGMDAAEFPLPASPLVCYFNNPFKEQVMTRVLKNIEESLHKHPREVIIIYLNPQIDYVFQGAPSLTNIRRKAWCSIYRSRVRKAISYPARYGRGSVGAQP